MAIITDIDKFYIDLGENIKNLREKLGYSQEEIGKYLDLTRTSIVNIEKGRQRSPLHTLYELASFFNVDINALLPQKNEKNQTDLMKEVEENLRSLEQTFKDVSFDQEKLSHFFQLSAKS